MNSKFDEIVNKAIAEHGKLEVTFIRVTDGGERTVEYSTYADFNYQYHVSKIVGRETLVKIEKITHDRVFSKDVKYVGAYFIFPEKIVEDNVSASNTYDPLKVLTADNGEKWHIRSLYVQQILEIKYNGTPVFKNSGVFDFGIIGDDGKEYRTVSFEDVKKIQAQIEQKQAEKMKAAGKQALVDKMAAEFIKSGKVPGYDGHGEKGMIPIDVAVHRHLGYVNGWGYDVEDCAARKALFQKHHQLAHLHPEEHQWYNAESESAQMHGFNDYRCKCGFGWAVDSSD